MRGRAFDRPQGSSNGAEDVREEIAFHLAARAAELASEGIPGPEAARRAEAEFGNIAETLRYCAALDRETARRARWRDCLTDLATGWRRDVRSLLRRPGTLVAGAGTLALGIAASTALWSVVRQVLIDPLPVPGGDRVVVLWEANPQSQVWLSPRIGAIAALDSSASSFESLEPLRSSSAVLVQPDGAEVVTSREVTEGFLPFLGAPAALGRGFRPEDRAPGSPPVAMLSSPYWRTHFGADASVIGQTLRLDESVVTVIGVMPDVANRVVHWFEDTDIWLALRTDVVAQATGFGLGRLRPGVTQAAADEELERLTPGLTQQHLAREGWSVITASAVDLLGTVNVRVLKVLLGAVVLLLLIAGANTAHVLLNRMLERDQEYAIRSALGARRGDLIRSALSEAAIIGLVGGMVGLAMAFPILRTLIRFRPPSLPQLGGVHVDLSAGLAALCLGLLTALLAGAVPAWRASRTGRGVGPVGGGSGARATRSFEGHRLRQALLVLEVAVAVLMLVGAGLLVRSMQTLRRAPLGFSPPGLFAVSVELPSWRFPEGPSQATFMQRAILALRATPGITGAAQGTNMPPQLGIEFGTVEIDGGDINTTKSESNFASSIIGPEYLQVLGRRLVQGRGFRAGSSEHEIMISRSLANHLWPAGGAVGHRLRLDGKVWQEVVGVLEDVPGFGLGEERGALEIVHPLASDGFGGAIAVRSDLPLDAVAERVRATLRSLDASVPIRDIQAAPEMLRNSMARERFTGLLLSVFAALAVILFALGLYGVLSQAVRHRTREIGIRMALGAQPQRVWGWVMRQALGPAAAGLALGITGALLGGRVLQALLHDVSPGDIQALVATGVVTLGIATVGGILPARRATRIDPVVALKEE